MAVGVRLASTKRNQITRKVGTVQPEGRYDTAETTFVKLDKYGGLYYLKESKKSLKALS